MVENIDPDLLKNAQFIKLKTEKTFLEDFVENKFVNYNSYIIYSYLDTLYNSSIENYLLIFVHKIM